MENNVNNSEKLDENINAQQPSGKARRRLTREVVTYLIFGVLTTAVGWAVYFAIMYLGRAILGIPQSDTSSGAYIGLYTAAQVIQWVCAVLFAFFTNRKWVFTDADKSKNIFSQLLAFSAGRVLTFVLDYVITFAGGLLLSSLLPSLNEVALLGAVFNLNEISAKLVAAVVVIIGNYIFSKLLVFRKR